MCVLEGDSAIYVSEYETANSLNWITPDRLAFRRNGLWGVRNPEGVIVIPDIFKTIVNYRQADYLIVQEQSGLFGCVDKEFNCISPCRYTEKQVREQIEELINNENPAMVG